MAMSIRMTPLFNVDGDGGSTSSSWGETLSEAYESSDDQPEMESEDEALDEEDNEEVEEMETSDDDESDADDQESTTEEPAFGDDTDVDMGEGRQAIKLSELKSGYLRQSDYTKKTQELATQRKEFETESEAMRPVKEWVDYMESNPWVWDQINQSLQQFHSTGELSLDIVLNDAEYGQHVNRLLAENSRLQKQLDKVSGEYEGAKLTSAMNTLKSELVSEYGDIVTDDYMSKLQERGKAEKLSTSTMREIADGFLAKEKLKANVKDVKQVSKKAEAKAMQKLAETKKTAPNAPKAKGNRPSTSKPDYSAMGWRQALESAANGD